MCVYYVRYLPPVPRYMSTCQSEAPRNQGATMAHLPPAAAAGDWHRLFDNTTAALATMDQLRQPEAAAALLMQKAEALQGVGDTHAAVQALDDLLAFNSSHPGALSLRASLHSSAGRWQSALFDLLQLQKVAPGWQGLLDRLQEAAAQCNKQHRAAPARPVRHYARVRRGLRSVGTGHGEQGGVGGGKDGIVVAAAYGVLGLSVGAPYADVRAAYKQLAARWHPDKLALQDKEGQGDGGDRFISIQSAYQQLVEHLQQSA